MLAVLFVTALGKCGGQILSRDEPSQLLLQQVSPCMNCKWAITASGKKRVRLTFSHFVLGPGDKVHVFNGHSTKLKPIGTYIQGDSPADVVSSGNAMTVKVVTDGCGPNPLINASVRAIGNASYMLMTKFN